MARGVARLNMAISLLSGGLGLAAATACIGAVAAAVVDASHKNSPWPGTFDVAWEVLPVALFYGVALALLVPARRRLRSVASGGAARQINSASSLVTAAIAITGVGLALNGVMAMFTLVEGLTIGSNGNMTGEGSVGVTTTGGWIGVIVGSAAQWPMLLAAAVVVVYLGMSLSAIRRGYSQDRRWWWDGASWQLLAGATGTSQGKIETHHAPRS